MSSLHPGVTWFEDDRGNGPFKIRIGGTSDFVKEINPTCKKSWPPGRVFICEGWDNPNALSFPTLEDALEAADQVWDIEGYHTSIEKEEP